MPEINYVWDPTEDNIVREYDEAGVVTAEYTTEPELYGNVISQRRQGEYRQFHFDGQGSTLAATDENQNATDTIAYTAFGEVTERTGTTEISFLYIGLKGYYTDGFTGQIMARARTYKTVCARWLTRDPLRYVDGPNLYTYIANNPIDSDDPSGMYLLRRRRRRRRCPCPYPPASPTPLPAPPPRVTTVSITKACPSDDPKCRPETCYWDNRIEDLERHVAISFLKDVIGASGKSLDKPCCVVDRNFGGDQSQLKLVLTFADGSTTGNIGSEYQRLLTEFGAVIEGSSPVRPPPGERIVIRVPKSHNGRTLSSFEFQERLSLTCSCGGKTLETTWCFNLKWRSGSTTGWEKEVDRTTDCNSLRP